MNTVPPIPPGAILPDDQKLAVEVEMRLWAEKKILGYIVYTSPGYKRSRFAEIVCDVLDKFLADVQAGKRPILILQAPPQHGKSEIVSRKLPAFLLGSQPSLRIGCASYSDELANAMAQDVRRNLASAEHKLLFPVVSEKRKYDVSRLGEFTAPGGTGSYLGVGVGAGLTGRPVDIGIIDDPVKNEQEALSDVTKERHWAWYQSVFTTRLSEHSGQIIMATQWAEDDLPARIALAYAGDPRLTHIRFPAINSPDEVNYQPELPLGALVPELHSLAQLKEIKGTLSDYWWSALYQQSAKAAGGNVFKEKGICFYLPKDLPTHPLSGLVYFDKVIDSWDCTFKDTDGTDFVVGQKWGKKGADAYLLAQIRARMSFTATVESVIKLYEMGNWQRPAAVYIEDKANGPAVIDVLKKVVPTLVPVEPDGSKLARAHAVTSIWEAGNVHLPHSDIEPWVRAMLSELTAFPVGAHDDQVDALSQALRALYPLFGRLHISKDILALARR